MKIQAIIVEKVSKAGNPYKGIELIINDKVKKFVFLNDAEVELINLTSKQQ